MEEPKKINKTRYVIQLPIIIALSLVVGILVGATFFGKKSFAGDVSNTSSKFKEILNYIESSYVDAVDTDSLADYGIQKMLEKLDPHTVYLPKEESEIELSQLQNGFDGIGVEFSIFKDTVYVITPLSGGPSETVGIQSGDAIISANGVSLTGKDLSNKKVFENLRGKRGTEVKLKIKRKGFKDLIDFKVIRNKIPTYSIDAAYLMADKKTAYIKINRFSETTYDEFYNALKDLKAKGMTQLLLDLRGNPGGYLERATAIVDELVGGKEVIVYTDGKDDRNDKKINAGNKGIFEQGPIVVLVDEGSASASEIVSGTLQDYDRALIVGRRTFGKGLVQAPITLSDGSELRLTISRYFIPSGRSIQKPYEMGQLDEYSDELLERSNHGEFFVADSIKNNTKLKFKTKKGRTVYGGGGITPDIFVARDTTYFTPYLMELYGQNIIREYALQYTTEHKSELQKMNFAQFLRSFQVNDAMLKELTNMAADFDIKFNASQFNRSKPYLQEQIKALIARTVWKESAKKGLNNEYFEVINANDPMIITALKSFGKAANIAK